MVRKASEKDKLKMGRVYCLSWKKGYEGIVPKGYLDSLTPENRAPKAVSPETSLVYERDSELVGLCSFGKGRTEETAGEIRAIYVIPNCWGSGIGKKLFDAAAAGLREMGFDSFYLWVLKDNPRARRFYEKNGMVVTGEQKDIVIGGKSLAEIKYRRWL